MSVTKTIVHPTDFSETSEHALYLAGRLARDPGTKLVVLHVAESHPYYAGCGSEGTPHHELMAERIDMLRAIDPGLLVHGRVVEGLAVEAILETAAEMRSDLIVMGSHGRTGFGRALLGSVAERVARQASCLVLILKGQHRSSAGWALEAASTGSNSPQYPTIIVPTDFSERSRGALAVADSLADQGSRVIVVHVVGPVHIASEGYHEALERRIREFTMPTPGVRVDYELREGDAAEEILHLASKVENPLIVIPSHGRTGLDRLFMGSVAEYILRGAPCPVLILRRAHRPGSSPLGESRL